VNPFAKRRVYKKEENRAAGGARLCRKSLLFADKFAVIKKSTRLLQKPHTRMSAIEKPV
jgi:hypothetical protein